MAIFPLGDEVKLLAGLLTAGAMVAACSPAWAAQTSYEVASNLGLVLASEEPCGVSFVQEAIDAYIEKNVAADDMEFAEFLAGTTTLGHFKIERMNETSLATHCAQIKRASKANGFLAQPAKNARDSIPFVIGEPLWTKPR